MSSSSPPAWPNRSLTGEPASGHRASEPLDVLALDALDPSLAERRGDVDALHRLAVLLVGEVGKALDPVFAGAMSGSDPVLKLRWSAQRACDARSVGRERQAGEAALVFP
jgi:hypothetical protein